MWLLSVIYSVTGKNNKTKQVLLSRAIKWVFPPENPNKKLVEIVKIIWPKLPLRQSCSWQLFEIYSARSAGSWHSDGNAHVRGGAWPNPCVPNTGCLPGVSTSGKPALTLIRGHVIIQDDELQGLIKQSGKCTDFSASPLQLWFQQTHLPCQGCRWWLKVPSITWW